MICTQTADTDDTPRLDVATKLGQPSKAIWRWTVGEHVVVTQVAHKPRDHVNAGEGANQVRAREEAQRRAKREVRRFAVHCKISRLVTLTFGDAHGLEARDDVVKACQAFFSGLRSRYGGVRYIYILELHPGGHGYHVHFGVDRYVPKHVIEECWGRGFVDVRRIKLKKQAPQHEIARGCARYLAKYACKADDEGRRLGAHRYERSQGVKIPQMEIECDSFEECVIWLKGKIRRPIQWMWCSLEDEEWRGPKVLCLWE